jgi:hypothetical protein
MRFHGQRRTGSDTLNAVLTSLRPDAPNLCYLRAHGPLPRGVMPTKSKMSELQDAMALYGETSVRVRDIIHAVGNNVIEGLPGYLGASRNCVFGVPPAGDWEAGTDYRGANFSTYRAGMLTVGPISMGLSIKIPHTKDDGSLWMRVVLEFLIEGDFLSVTIGDSSPLKGLPLRGAITDLEPIYGGIFAYVKGYFADPVAYFKAERTGKIGFLAG